MGSLMTRQQYAKLPWYSQLGQAADDIVRLGANGLSFGLADKAAAALGEENTAAKTAAALDRAGVAGDAAGLLGAGGGLKLGWNGVKAVPKIVRTVAPKLSAKAALGAAALGAGSLASYNNRTATPASPKASATTKAPAATKVQARGSSKPPSFKNADKVADNILAAMKPNDALDLDGIAQRIAAAQGGQISLRQLGAAAEIVQRTAPRRTGRGPQPGDAAGQMLEDMYVTQFNKALQDPNADVVKAQEEFEQKVLQLRKTRFNNFADEFGLDPEGQ